MSSSLSTGIGGSPGGPPTTTHLELEQSAASLGAKIALGMLQEGSSIVQSFTEVNPRYISGYMGGFGYRSAAGNPLLDHPLEATISSVNLTPQSTTEWEDTYEELSQQLPPDIANALAAQMQLPPSERHPDFIALNEVMVLAATVLTQA